MARLPVPGSDNNVWGGILNEFLSVAHDDDGTIKADAVGSDQLADNAVSSAKIAPDAVTNDKIASLGAVSGVAALDSDGDPVTSGGVKAVTQTSLDASTAANIISTDSDTAQALATAAGDSEHPLRDAIAALANAVTPPLVLESGDPIPEGTPANTVIVRKSPE